ncbi:MAG: hypothetical protein NPIRA03_05800 [Nitrospirales bacterium]|nr:MAG: hypothetical protein NPIRA03_05800 [Nitrospirales bacterium]
MVPKVQEPEAHRVYPGDTPEIQDNVLTSPVYGPEDQIPDTNGGLSIKPSRKDDNSCLMIQFFADLKHGIYLFIRKTTKMGIVHALNNIQPFPKEPNNYSLRLEVKIRDLAEKPTHKKGTPHGTAKTGRGTRAISSRG